MRVLLINPPDEMEAMFGVGKGLVQKYEPLGLLSMAAVARDAGHEVAVIDAWAEDLDLDRLQKRIEGVAPEVVGISTLTCNGALVWRLGRWVKQTMEGCLVVLGNVHASVYARQYLRGGCCDVVAHGEGEHTLLRLLECRGTNRSFDGVGGISYLDAHGRVFQTSPAEVVDDLDALPWPARDLVNQELYRLTELSNQNYVCAAGERAKTMITSRGCLFRCSFCVVHHDAGPRFASARRVVDELEMLERDHGAGYVYIQDALFMGNRRRVFDICDEIGRRGLRIRWGCDANVNLLSVEMIRAMATANCFELSLGIESGVQRHLDAAKKGITTGRVVEAVNDIRNNSDIRIEGLFILGFPGETWEEAMQTIRFATSLPIDMAQFSIMTPYPGSALYNELAAGGELDTGIRGEDEVDPSVWKRYSSYIMFTDNEPIWVTPTLSHREILKLQKKALRAFYLRPAQIVDALKRVRSHNVVDTVKIAFKGFF